MGIQKQAFYEGAALHTLARSGAPISLRYEAPFFVLNDCLLLHLKHCTMKRSPWGFTVTDDERRTMRELSTARRLVIGLICGSDGIAALEHEEFAGVAGPPAESIHVSCYRDHREHYRVAGPAGSLSKKISPSAWLRLLEDR